MSDTPYQEHWHLSKSIPVSIIFFLALQTIGIVIWAVRLDLRVDTLEKANPIQDMRLTRLEEIYSKVAVMEDRQNSMIKRMDVQTVTMQEILNLMNNRPIPKP